MTSFAPQSITFAPLAENLAPARDFLRRYIAASGWGGSDLDVVIAIGEVLQNIVRHGFSGGSKNGVVDMTAALEDGTLSVIIDDNAPSSIPAEWSNSGRESYEGGLGLGIIERIASDVTFQPTSTGNRATLCFVPE
ncbi:MAG: ATP-binding protein [Candidatus Puniceispirillaceae bacterium]